MLTGPVVWIRVDSFQADIGLIPLKYQNSRFVYDLGVYYDDHTYNTVFGSSFTKFLGFHKEVKSGRLVRSLGAHNKDQQIHFNTVASNPAGIVEVQQVYNTYVVVLLKNRHQNISIALSFHQHNYRRSGDDMHEYTVWQV